jgi:DNA-binding response OmpR family regulator
MQDESQRNEVAVDSEDTPITIGPIRIDPLQWAVTVDGELHRLTPVEYMVLRFLADHADTVCTSDQIGSSIWGPNNNYQDSGLIKMHIRHVRQKIEPDPMHPMYLLTIPERGYMLVSHDQNEMKE